MGRALVLLFASALACRTSPPPPAALTVEVRDPATHRGDFTWREEVTVRVAGQPARVFEAALEKRGDALRLVGLSPLGTVLFVAEAVGREVRFDNRTGEPLPFDGGPILRDVTRAHFDWLDGPVEGGARAGEGFGELVEERFQGGALVERRFLRSGVTVAYRPGVALLSDPALGYELEIRRLPSP